MVVVPSFLTLSTGLFIGHPVGGLTGGEETRVLSIYTFISSNPSAISISKKNRQRNGQKKKYKRTNNDLQNIHIKLKNE
jgi:hypothetical protein